MSHRAVHDEVLETFVGASISQQVHRRLLRHAGNQGCGDAGRLGHYHVRETGKTNDVKAVLVVIDDAVWKLFPPSVQAKLHAIEISRMGSYDHVHGLAKHPES